MWRINLVENTVQISQKCAEELMKSNNISNCSWDLDYFGDDAWPTENFKKGGLLFFDEDSNEHMDYVHDENLQNILLKHKVNGKIIFNSFEGDNKGKAWGYFFDDGVCTTVEGSAKTMKLKPVK